jgi:hypothetical protein
MDPNLCTSDIEAIEAMEAQETMRPYRPHRPKKTSQTQGMGMELGIAGCISG